MIFSLIVKSPEPWPSAQLGSAAHAVSLLVTRWATRNPTERVAMERDEAREAMEKAQGLASSLQVRLRNMNTKQQKA